MDFLAAIKPKEKARKAVKQNYKQRWMEFRSAAKSPAIRPNGERVAVEEARFIGCGQSGDSKASKKRWAKVGQAKKTRGDGSEGRATEQAPILSCRMLGLAAAIAQT